MTEFIDLQKKRLRDLVGRHLSCWRGVEEALRGGDESGPPVFADVSVPYLQFWSLYAREGDEFLEFTTYQNGDNFGLALERAEPARALEVKAEGIWRARDVREIPDDLVESVEVKLDEQGDIERVELQIGGSVVLMIAGEVYEENDGSLRVQLGGDESVLVSVRRL